MNLEEEKRCIASKKEPGIDCRKLFFGKLAQLFSIQSHEVFLGQISERKRDYGNIGLQLRPPLTKIFEITLSN